jgi:hypothetical protein
MLINLVLGVGWRWARNKKTRDSNGKDEKAKRQDGIVMVDGIWVQ